MLATGHCVQRFGNLNRVEITTRFRGDLNEFHSSRPNSRVRLWDVQVGCDLRVITDQGRSAAPHSPRTHQYPSRQRCNELAQVGGKSSSPCALCAGIPAWPGFNIACEIRNPQGTCCLGNVQTVVKRVQDEENRATASGAGFAILGAG